MSGTLRFRNLDVSPQDPVEQWPVEAVATALDRGELPDWHQLALAIEADPYGEVARRVEEALPLVDSLGIGELIEQLIVDVREELAKVRTNGGGWRRRSASSSVAPACPWRSSPLGSAPRRHGSPPT